MYTANGLYIKRTGTAIEHFQETATAAPPPPPSFPSSLDQLFNHPDTNKSGVYRMWLNNRVVNVYVYIEPQNQKKWLLVLRYNRLAGTNPQLRPITPGNHLPIPENLTNHIQYVDESKTPGQPGWGHLDQSYLQQFTINEVAFFGTTSQHLRTINFSSTSPSAIAYVQKFSGIFKSGRAFGTAPATLFGKTETAIIPKDTQTQFPETNSIYDPPFLIPGLAHWSIKRANTIWEVDNVLDTNNGFSHSTLHMVFIR